MPGVPHDHLIRHSAARLGGDEARAQVVPVQPAWVQAGALAGSHEDQGHQLIGEPTRLDLVVAVDRREDRPL
jgi:hypothetical protein